MRQFHVKNENINMLSCDKITIFMCTLILQVWLSKEIRENYFYLKTPSKISQNPKRRKGKLTTKGRQALKRFLNVMHKSLLAFHKVRQKSKKL